LPTSLAPGSKKMSKHTLAGGNGRELLDLLARLKTRAEQRIAAPVKVMAIHEAGLDGFWVHRLLSANGVESHVVDPASIAVPRRHRRAKTDAIDGETLLRTLMAWQRGEPAGLCYGSAAKPERRGLPSGLARTHRAAAGAHSPH
jgi:transposase